MKLARLLVFTLLWFGITQAQADGDALVVRIVDTGPGLCTITSTADGSHMVYDAGHWTGSQCSDVVRDIVGDGQIDIFVISHADADHLGQADDILSNYTPVTILRTGLERWGTNSWEDFDAAVESAVADGSVVFDLQEDFLAPGTKFELGAATLTVLSGRGSWPDRTGLSESEHRNVISIVLRLDYEGRSVIFGGDTLGRELDDPDDTCIYAEGWMVETLHPDLLDADVLIAPHHGGNNGSATCFIEAVSPEYVIFSAGHDHGHPSAATAQRYIASGVDSAKILRTDRGDDEGHNEWTEGSIDGCRDDRGDDDIEITISNSGELSVMYLSAASGC
jgi:competence protein ComEC